MVEFGKKLQTSRKEEWAEYYIDYDRLKKTLKAPDHRRRPSMASLTGTPLTIGPTRSLLGNADKHHNRRPTWESTDGQWDADPSTFNNILPSATNSTRSNSSLTHHQEELLDVLEFRRALDQEIEKIVLFLLQQQGTLAEQLASFSQPRKRCLEHVSDLVEQVTDMQTLPEDGIAITSTNVDQDIQWAYQTLQELSTQYRSVAESVLEFVVYVELNVTAVRKILKKHDKNHPKFKLSRTYLSSFASDIDTHLDQLYNYGGLSAFMATLKRAFAELYQMECHLVRLRQQPPLQSPMSAHELPPPPPSSDFVLTEPWDPETPSRTSLPLAKRAKFQSLPTQYTSAREPLLDKIHAARSKLKQSTQYVDVVAAQALLFDEGAESVGYDEDQERAARVSAFLNLCSTFLYMMNYYIVAPTTGQYATKLGSTEAMAGIIIGMTPNAALLATVLYGWWSNYSYKPALLFAATSSLAGNIFYAVALRYHSLTFVMIGRFLNGFGSARSINRRFIADTFSRSKRTAASADFVTAAALGMAAGPAVAAMLGRMHDKTEDDSSLLWTVETSPGWVMMVLWFLFIVAASCYFEEPDRSHLFGTPNKEEPSTELTHIGETKPLLSNSEESIPAEPPLYRNVPVMVTLWVYFVLKLVLECLLSSCATLTSYYFNWDAQLSGSFLAFLGLLMFPANILVAKLASRYEDRELIYVSLVVMAISVLGVLQYRPDHYTVEQYIIFGICIFLSTNILEGPNMSLLSKTIPKSWARGTFNSGFLATEAGTAARSIGDVLISAAAAFAGFSHVLNATFLPLFGLVLLSVVGAHVYFNEMIEDDDDDDASQKHAKDE